MYKHIETMLPSTVYASLDWLEVPSAPVFTCDVGSSYPAARVAGSEI